MGGLSDEGSQGPTASSAWASRFLAGFTALTLIVLSTSPAPAQEDSRPFQFRAFLTTEGEYNDNFFLSEKNKRDEFRESLTPGVSFRLSTGRSQAEISYAPTLIHSSLIDEAIQVFHLFDAKGSLALAERLTLNGGDHFVRTDQPTIVDPRSTQRNRSILLSNTLNSDLIYKQETWSLTPHYSLTYNKTELENQTGGAQVGNQASPGTQERSIVHAIGSDGTLDILGRNTLGAGYELTVGDFRVANDFIGQLGRVSFSREVTPLMTASLTGSLAHRDVQGGSDYNIYRGDIGLRREVSPLYAVEGRVGYGVFDVIGGKSRGSFEYTLKGHYTGKTVQITTSSGQTYQETFTEGTNIGVTRTLETTVEVRYEPTDRLAFTLRGGLAQNDFLQSSAGTTVGQQQERKDLVLNGGLELALKLTRLLSLTLGYTYSSTDSNLRGLDYQNNRVRLGLTATYE